MPCEKEQELRQAAIEILKRIDESADVQIQAMRNRDDEKLIAADKELETLYGEKQRAFGALFEHRNEHGC